MSRRATLALAWVASIGVALLAGSLLLAPHPKAAPPARASGAPIASAPRPSTTFVTVPRAGAPGLGADEVRSILREELAARDDGDGAAHDGDEEEAAARDQEALAASPERQAAVARATKVISVAVERGTWTEADRDALRAERGVLHGRDYMTIAHELFPAINEGRVKPTFLGSIL